MILGICGAGGSGREILELAKIINKDKQYWDQILFVEKQNFMNKTDDNLKGITISSFKELIQNNKPDQIEFIVSVGEPQLRKKIATEILETGYHLATLIHPNVHIPESTKIGDGVIISCNAFISCNVVIEDNVMIQPSVVIGHDAQIGKNTIISANSSIAGGAFVGENTYIALNVCVREQTRIGNNVIVSAGSAVLKDIVDEVIAQGNPARPLLNRDNSNVFR